MSETTCDSETAVPSLGSCKKNYKLKSWLSDISLKNRYIHIFLKNPFVARNRKVCCYRPITQTVFMLSIAINSHHKTIINMCGKQDRSL